MYEHNFEIAAKDYPKDDTRKECIKSVFPWEYFYIYYMDSHYGPDWRDYFSVRRTELSN